MTIEESCLTLFYGHGHALGRAHDHRREFYGYVTGQGTLTKSVPAYNYEYNGPSDCSIKLCNYDHLWMPKLNILGQASKQSIFDLPSMSKYHLFNALT